jgi:hypothetical protein
MIDDSAFREMVVDFLNIILGRKPPTVTDAERVVLAFLRSEDENGRFE